MPPLGVGQAWDAEGGFLGKLNTLPSLVSQAAPPAEGGEGGRLGISSAPDIYLQVSYVR